MVGGLVFYTASLSIFHEFFIRQQQTKWPLQSDEQSFDDPLPPQCHHYHFLCTQLKRQLARHIVPPEYTGFSIRGVS